MITSLQWSSWRSVESTLASTDFSCLNFSFEFAIMFGTFLLKNELLLGSARLILIFFSFFSYLLILARFRLMAPLGWNPSLICDAIFKGVVCMLALIFFPLYQNSVLGKTKKLKNDNILCLIQQDNCKLLYMAYYLENI